MRWWIFLLALLIVPVFFPLSDSSNDKIENEVFEALEQQSEIPVIVQLKGEVSSGYGIFSVQEDVVVEDVVEDVESEDVQVNKVYDALEGFAGKVNAAGLQRLQNDNRVERVYYDSIVQVQLQNSRGVVNATKVYGRYINSMNITGRNQTICIIDTGINASLNEFSGKIVGQYCFCSLNEGTIGGVNTCCTNNASQSANAVDNNGHGTHVAGTAAANGTNGSIWGIAPDALLVVIKTMNSSGSGSSSDIISGINYCLNNRTIFNISVISMSLGSGSYTDEDTCQTTDAIAPTASLAVANGIFVVASSGNSESTTAISAPACAKNVTSVGAVTKSLAIPSYSNRGALLDLLAPGGANDGSQNNDINSSSYDNSDGQRYKSGTSMAAPHVAGVAALLLQYKKEENGTTLNPLMLQDVLNDTGFRIADSGSGLNFSVVDALAALIHLDAKSPNVSLNITPLQANFSVNNVTLNFTALDTNLGNYSINVTFPNGTLLASSSQNITLGPSNLSVVGNYSVLVFANDSNGNVNITQLNLTVTGVDVVLISPVQFFNTTNTSLSMNCSASSYNALSNISLYTNVSGSFLLNKTTNLTGTKSSSNFSLAGLADGNYLWNCLAYDNRSTLAWASSNRTFIVDTLLPKVQLLTPGNNTNESGGSGVVAFVFNATDTYLRNCSLVVDDVAEQSNNSILSAMNNSFTKTFTTNSYYNWNVNCTDHSNNVNSSVTFRVNVSVTTTTTTTTLGGGGGGGSGGGAGSAGATTTTTPTTTLKAAPPSETITKERVYQQEESVTDILALEQENPELKLALTLTNKEAESLAVAGSAEASVSRNLESGDGVSTVETQFTFTAAHSEIVMYDEVPKIFAADASKIQVAVQDGGYQIVKADPVFVFTFRNVSAGKNYKVSYSVVELMPASILEVFDKPILMYDKGEQPALEEPAQISGAGVVGGAKQLVQKYQRFWWAGAAGILMVIIGMMLWGGRGQSIEQQADVKQKLP